MASALSNFWQRLSGAARHAAPRAEQPKLPADALVSAAKAQAVSEVLHEACALVRASGIQRLVLYVEPYGSHAEATKECDEIIAGYGKLVCTDYYQERLLDERETKNYRGCRLAAHAQAYAAVALIQAASGDGMIPSFVSMLSPQGSFVTLQQGSARSSPLGKVLFEMSYRVPFTGRFLPAMVADNTTYCNLRVLLEPENQDQLQLIVKGLLQEGKSADDLRAAVQYGKRCYESNLAGLMGEFSGLRFPRYPAGAS